MNALGLLTLFSLFYVCEIFQNQDIVTGLPSRLSGSPLDVPSLAPTPGTEQMPRKSLPNKASATNFFCDHDNPEETGHDRGPEGPKEAGTI